MRFTALKIKRHWWLFWIKIQIPVTFYQEVANMEVVYLKAPQITFSCLYREHSFIWNPPADWPYTFKMDEQFIPEPLLKIIRYFINTLSGLLYKQQCYHIKQFNLMLPSNILISIRMRGKHVNNSESFKQCSCLERLSQTHAWSGAASSGKNKDICLTWLR